MQLRNHRHLLICNFSVKCLTTVSKMIFHKHILQLIKAILQQKCLQIVTNILSVLSLFPL